jgi:hypothetical protein
LFYRTSIFLLRLRGIPTKSVARITDLDIRAGISKASHGPTYFFLLNQLDVAIHAAGIGSGVKFAD